MYNQHHLIPSPNIPRAKKKKLSVSPTPLQQLFSQAWQELFIEIHAVSYQRH